MMKNIYPILLFVVLCFASQGILMAQQLAFPGAEGAGRFTSGGRGVAGSPTTVFKVTSLSDVNTPGTLRYAVSASTATYPHRTIVFDVSGTIHLTSSLIIRGNTTIAGQTAPGDGICIADYPVSISGNNVIMRYVRIRMGDKNQNLGMVDGSGNGDALGSLGYSNIIVDHCSISWSSDEACTIYRGDNLTLQWNIVSEPLNYSYHFEAGGSDYQEHGYGGIWGARRASFHHNVIAHAKGRMPRFAGSSTYTPGTVGQENANFYNNVIYNWQSYSTNGGEGGNYNIMNNYYKYGPNTSSGSSGGVAIRFQIMNPSKSGSLPYPKIFMEGNFVDGSTTVSNRNWLGVSMSGGSLADTNQSKVVVPFDISPYTLQSATDAYVDVLNNAGAILPRRDTLDARIINDIRYRTGKIIDVQGGFPHGTPYLQTVNAWPTLGTLPAPMDSDNDGMPDSYENTNGLNASNADDRAIVAPNGFTNLENYLNGIVNVLPINLLGFDGWEKNKGAILSWSATANDQLNYFLLERKIATENFKDVQRIQSSGLQGNSQYEYFDLFSYDGDVFYRLKMVDKDASFQYSPVVIVKHKLQTGFSIFPNPAASTVTVVHADGDEMMELQVVDAAGQILQRQAVMVGARQSTLNVQSLKAGLYNVVVKSKNNTRVAGFIKL